MQHLNSVELAAWVGRKELERRQIEPQAIVHGILGITVAQHHTSYGLPWLTGLMGLDHVAG